jgi:hypothetical protein
LKLGYYLFGVFKPFPPFRGNIEFDDINDVIHYTEQALFFFQIVYNLFCCYRFNVGVAFAIDFPDDFAFLDLVKYGLDFVGQVVVGEIPQQFVLNLFKEMADLQKLKHIVFVLY